MKTKKSLWTSITGGLTSAAPVLLSCCKSGACIGVCASPVASLFGISSATMASSPWISALEPLLIAISAVSFTVSYYSIYVLPKQNCSANTCACENDSREKRRSWINKIVFWLGLSLSIGFLGYFEYTKYQKNQAVVATCVPGDDNAASENCCASADSTACQEEVPAAACDSTSACCRKAE